MQFQLMCSLHGTGTMYTYTYMVHVFAKVNVQMCVFAFLLVQYIAIHFAIPQLIQMLEQNITDTFASDHIEQL